MCTGVLLHSKPLAAALWGMLCLGFHFRVTANCHSLFSGHTLGKFSVFVTLKDREESASRALMRHWGEGRVGIYVIYCLLQFVLGL